MANDGHALKPLPGVTWIVADVRDGLRQLPDASAQAIVTSPPFWGLRDYGVEPTVWGGSPDCAHEWGVMERGKRKDILPEDVSTLVARVGTDERQNGAATNGGRFCTNCKAWRGCLGLEPTPELFVSHLADIFDLAARVLRKDGVLWLNLGDSYAGGGRAGKNPEYQDRHTMFGKPAPHKEAFGVPMGVPSGMKGKDLVGIPWMTAFELRRRGWYLRAACPWIKRSVMPESTTDRPNTAHECVFLFAHPESGGRYFYDHHAVRMPAARVRARGPARSPVAGQTPALRRQDGLCRRPPESTRNYRTSDPFFASLQAILDGGEGLISNEEGDPLALVVNPRPFKKAHFATWPPQLVEPMIKAGSRPNDVVLDLFGGAGTTILKARELGRRAIYIDSNPEYASMAIDRLGVLGF